MGFPSMGMASLGLSAGSGVLGAIGSIAGGNAQAANDKYQAGLALRNAATSAQAADVAQSQGTFQAQPYFQQGSQRMGAARAGFGADGIDINSGSAVADQASIARTTALNTNAVSYDADAKAVGYRNQAANDTTQAGLDQAAARQATASGWMGAGTSILGAASSVAEKWNSFKNNLPGATSGNATIEGFDPASTGTSGFGSASNPWSAAALPTVG